MWLAGSSNQIPNEFYVDTRFRFLIMLCLLSASAVFSMHAFCYKITTLSDLPRVSQGPSVKSYHEPRSTFGSWSHFRIFLFYINLCLLLNKSINLYFGNVPNYFTLNGFQYNSAGVTSGCRETGFWLTSIRNTSYH